MRCAPDIEEEVHAGEGLSPLRTPRRAASAARIDPRGVLVAHLPRHEQYERPVPAPLYHHPGFLYAAEFAVLYTALCAPGIRTWTKGPSSRTTMAREYLIDDAAALVSCPRERVLAAVAALEDDGQLRWDDEGSDWVFTPRAAQLLKDSVHELRAMADALGGYIVGYHERRRVPAPTLQLPALQLPRRRRAERYTAGCLSAGPARVLALSGMRPFVLLFLTDQLGRRERAGTGDVADTYRLLGGALRATAYTKQSLVGTMTVLHYQRYLDVAARDGGLARPVAITEKGRALLSEIVFELGFMVCAIDALLASLEKSFGRIELEALYGRRLPTRTQERRRGLSWS